MAPGRVFTANVVLARHRGGETTEFSIGDEVPQWAIDRVGDHVSQGTTRAADAPAPVVTNDESADENTGAADAADTSTAEEKEDTYASWTKDELKEEVKARELEGYNSKLSKDDLVALLEADDEG